MKKILLMVFMIMSFMACMMHPDNSDTEDVIGKRSKENTITIYYKAPSDWNEDIYMHSKSGNYSWTILPGIKMLKITDESNNFYGYYKRISSAEKIRFCLNENGEKWDNNNGNDYLIEGYGKYIVENGKVEKVEKEEIDGVYIRFTGTYYSAKGITANMYKNGEEYKICELNYNNELYFESLDPGLYTVKIDQARKGLVFSADIEFEIIERNKTFVVSTPIYVNKDKTTRVDLELSGIEDMEDLLLYQILKDKIELNLYWEDFSKIYKNTEFVKDDGGKIFINFPELYEGKYKAEIVKFKKYSYEYSGSIEFEVNREDHIVKNIELKKKDITNTYLVYRVYSDNGDLSDEDLIGIKGVLINKTTGESREVYSKDTVRGVAFWIRDLFTGEYEFKVEDEKDGYKFEGSDTVTVTQGTSSIVGGIRLKTKLIDACDVIIEPVDAGGVEFLKRLQYITVKLYKTGDQDQTTPYKRLEIGYDSEKDKVYARYFELPPGEYIMEIDEERYNRHYIAEGSFSVKSGEKEKVVKLEVRQKEKSGSELKLYFEKDGYTEYPNGITAKIYKDGAFYKELGFLKSDSRGIYMDLDELDLGVYTFDLDYTKDEFRYFGNLKIHFEEEKSYVKDIFVQREEVATKDITIYYSLSDDWSHNGNVNIHYNADNKAWTNVPGVAMNKHSIQSEDWFKYASITIEARTLKFCFNKDGHHWDNNHGNDYYVAEPGVYEIKNGKIIKK